jgi:hypothetical protein
MSVASVKTAPQKAEHSEILDVLGPRIQFLTALSDDDGAYCLIRGVVPAGVVVPLHSHPERDILCSWRRGRGILGGSLEQAGRWRCLRCAWWSQARLAKCIRRVRLIAVGDAHAVGPVLSQYWPTGSEY